MIAMLLALLAMAPAPQAARDVRVTITVVDQSGAVIPNAKVTIPPGEAVVTNDKGIATISGLAVGKVSITAEFPGFETRTLKDVSIKAGENKHVIVLPIQGLQDSVTVSRDARETASDRKATFGSAMTREQIEALSDDPDEMAQQLKDIAGSDAVIRVDSFEGGRLPPKSAIKAIHITRDAFAAENHYAGGLFVDIITQPGIGPLRTGMNFRLRDGSLSGKPPDTIVANGTKGPERMQNYGLNFGGSLIKNKASFSMSVNGGTSFDTPYYYYYLPDGSLVNTLAPRRPRDNMFVYGLFDYAITRDQTLRVRYSHDSFTSKNLGVGGYDVQQRAYSSEEKGHYVQIQEAGPLGRRFFINTRAMINWSDSENRSVFEAETINVLQTFVNGGQQRRGGVHSRGINLQSDLDYVRGMNSWRGGVQLEGSTYHSDDWSHYLGTYTFESLDAFNAGIPRSYTRRIGDPNIKYRNLQAGMYLQDDIRVRKNLTLSPGFRYEAQTHLDDYDNFGPRFGATWSPGKAGTMTLRGSVGIFYDWLSTNIYEQTLRVDGEHQREINVAYPTYPVDPNVGGTRLPTNKYLLGDNLAMQRNFRVSAGIDRGITKMLRVNALYAHTRGSNLMRGLNLNNPVAGERPDPNYSNVVEVVGDAWSQANSLNLGASLNFNVASNAPGPMMMGPGIMIMAGGGAPPPPPPPGTRPTPANARWNWRRMSVFTNVYFGRSYNNTDGAFSLPATGRFQDDWGPAAFDIRNRFNVSWSSQQLRNLNMNINLNASTSPPYTIRTGYDTNGDLAFTDRPDGVGRNTERASGQWTTNGNFSYGWSFGKPVERAGGITLRGDAGGISASQGAATTQGRYRLTLNLNVQNMFNHHNPAGFSFVQTSKAYGQPTSFTGTRKVDIGLSLTF